MIFQLFVGISPKISVVLFWSSLGFIWKFYLRICPFFAVFGGGLLFKYDPLFTWHLFLSCLILLLTLHNLVTLVKLLGNPKHKPAMYCFYYYYSSPVFYFGIFSFFLPSPSAEPFLGKPLIREGFGLAHVVTQDTGICYCLEGQQACIHLHKGCPRSMGTRFDKCLC